ncbi:hypothetical protein HNE05_00910 [Aquipseudomonas campi]|uniref:Uncharacterized protein n=1 Tax=Aquipseudomonas campi TaxID=2731681 RepID=A0A6M8F0Y7_9GAMM|nr:hypothetical protein [Pseudomonas campi]QKE61984.1 hypothetical protein HNE05_00910 [Pseudomonas campi]
MRLRKMLTGLALFLTVLLLASEAVMHEAFRKPVDAPIAMTPNAEATADFWILLPGAYQLDLVFNAAQPHARQKLKSVLGQHGCWNSKSNSPCGEYLPYSIKWEVRSESEVITSGVGTELTRGGHLRIDSRGTGLGAVALPAGRLTLHAVAESPLPQLSNLSPRLVLSGGTGGAKTFQSPFVTYVWTFWALGRLALWYAAGLLWLAVALVWFRTEKRRQRDIEVSA